MASNMNVYKCVTVIINYVERRGVNSFAPHIIYATVTPSSAALSAVKRLGFITTAIKTLNIHSRPL